MGDSLAGCNPCDNCGPQGFVTIVQGYATKYYVDLYYQETGEPYDLTGATLLTAAHPGSAGQTSPVVINPTVVGAAGAGKLLVTVSAVNSALMAVNPNLQQFQDLMIAITNADSTVTAFPMKAVLNIVAPPYGAT